MLPRLNIRPLLTAALLAGALLGAGVAAGTYAVLDEDGAPAAGQEVAASSQPAVQTSRTLSVNEIYRRTSPGVVEITAASSSDPSPFPFRGDGRRQAQGSGFVYDEQGHIVTNEHVVDGADSLVVTFANGARHTARLVGADTSSDLAVLDVDAPRSLLTPLALGGSADLEVGDGVVAIGSPFGLENSVTSGIVSGLHRQIDAPNEFAIDDAIQTDAAINHGNSGGPLLDLHGRVIGVNAQIRSESGGNDGVGLAIPSNTVRRVVAQLISSGKVEHAYLGVAVQTIPSEVARALGVPEGAALTEVVDGAPAADAGLKAATRTRTVNGQSYPLGGDVVTRAAGQRVTTADELRSLIDARQPGDEITLTVVRGGSERTVRVTLGTRPS